MSEAFWSHWGWPAATAVLGFVYAFLVFRQWLSRRKPHQLAWTVGLLFYAVAAVMESVSEATQHWDPTVYRVYIVLAASLTAFLGLGTLYLIVKDRLWGHIFLAFTVGCIAVFLYGTFTTELVADKLLPGITVGGQALGTSGSFPRIMSLPLNIPGTLFLFGGAIISIFRFARKKEYAYRMWANVLIALGTVVIGWAGAQARLGKSVGLYPAEMVASAILLAGFLMAGTLDKGARAARSRVAAERASSGDAAPESSETAG